jgi:hypothetical protein
MRRSLIFVLVIFLAAPAVTSCGEKAGASGTAGDTAAPTPRTLAGEPVLREILAAMEDPPGAPGRRLTLVRYTIAPGAKLAPHIHPGVQMASIVAGTLTYRVVSGSATVQRAVGGDGAPRVTEELEGPAETTLGPGDAVIENGDMVHFGANETGDPVVILATLITDASQNLAVTVTTASGQ